LTIPKSLRVEHGLDEEKVLKALLDAKCCRSGTSVIAGCPRCKCQPVVNLVQTAKWPQVNESDEVYTCSIRTRCSSSRDHLKSSLTLVIDGLPLSQFIVSNTFVLLARDKTQAPKRNRSYDYEHGSMDSSEEDDKDDDEDDKGGESTGEIPRKSPHKAGAGSKRRQRRSKENKKESKPSTSTTSAEISQNQAKTDPRELNETQSFPPVTTTFPSTGLQQQDTIAISTSTNSTSNGSTPTNSGVNSESSQYVASRSNSEGLYNSIENGQRTTMEIDTQQNTVFSSGVKNQSPIQPSSVSLPSPTPCSTPTGIIYEQMNINTYNAQPVEQIGWLSPVMLGASVQQ